MTDSSLRNRLPGSFRDPCGFLFFSDGILFRQVNYAYKDNYDQLFTSGLYDALVDSELLIPHQDIDIEPPVPNDAYKLLKPEVIDFISYPYEWCFSQLKDAALTTLRIQKKAVDCNMSLKDCSAYNIQFKNSKPIFIDTLSFEAYREGEPWVAYRQFCQHFLAPLALMSYQDVRLNQLLRIYIDGIPLDLCGLLLPKRTRFNFSLLSHIHLHAKSQQKYAAKPGRKIRKKMSRMSFLGLIDSLESTVKKLKRRSRSTEWADYYENTNYSEDAFVNKNRLIKEYLDKVQPENVWDLGGNTGIFSRIASEKGIPTVCFDVDPVAVEYHYLDCTKNNYQNILPLVSDLTNPSPGIGWQNTERMSFIDRGPADMIFALALIHHLAISNNLPFERIAEFFSSICSTMIIEFVPKIDSQVQRLLASREDIFSNYNKSTFESTFCEYFAIENSEQIPGSERTLYLMRRKTS